MTATWRWSTMKNVDVATNSSSKKPAMTKPMRFMAALLSAFAVAAAAAIARAHVDGAGDRRRVCRRGRGGRRRHRRRGAGRRLLQELVERQREQAGVVAGVDHDLGDV